MTDSWLDRSLEDLANLPPATPYEGDDGYIVPLPDKAKEWAAKCLRKLADAGLPRPSLAATPYGAVSARWDGHGRNGCSVELVMGWRGPCTVYSEMDAVGADEDPDDEFADRVALIVGAGAGFGIARLSP